jgi:hypothetical protein
VRPNTEEEAGDQARVWSSKAAFPSARTPTGRSIVIGRFRPPYEGYPDLITCVVSDVVTDVLIDV